MEGVSQKKQGLQWQMLMTALKTLFDKLQSTSSLRKKSKDFQHNVSGFGCPKKASTSVLQRMAFESLIGATVHSGLFHDRFICSSVVYHLYKITQLLKREIIQLYS